MNAFIRIQGNMTYINDPDMMTKGKEHITNMCQLAIANT